MRFSRKHPSRFVCMPTMWTSPFWKINFLYILSTIPTIALGLGCNYSTFFLFRSLKKGCTFEIQLRMDKDGQNLKVVKFTDTHNNHIVDRVSHVLLERVYILFLFFTESGIKKMKTHISVKKIFCRVSSLKNLKGILSFCLIQPTKL